MPVVTSTLRNPIRVYRLDRKLSLAELGAQIGLGRAEMSAVEDGRKTISREQQAALADLFGVDPSEFQYAVHV